MNITYSIDKVLRIVTLTYTGNPDFNEWVNTMRAVFKDPNFKPGFSVILDRRLVKIAPTMEYIEEITAFVKDHPIELGKNRTAIVVSEIASFGMARMFQGLMNETERTQIFTDIEKAREWLSIPGLQTPET
jgi:hypothetical protein